MIDSNVIYYSLHETQKLPDYRDDLVLVYRLMLLTIVYDP